MSLYLFTQRPASLSEQLIVLLSERHGGGELVGGLVSHWGVSVPALVPALLTLPLPIDHATTISTG